MLSGTGGGDDWTSSPPPFYCQAPEGIDGDVKGERTPPNRRQRAPAAGDSRYRHDPVSAGNRAAFAAVLGRLATHINYRTGKVYVRRVMTHEEYSRENWKKL
jgi:hypothetical protein